MNEANQLVSLIRELVKDEIGKIDMTCPCVVQSINSDKTVNITIPPDDGTIIKNIVNASKYVFTSGDKAILYKIKNKLNNSFIIGRYDNKTNEDRFQELYDYIYSIDIGSANTNTIVQNGGGGGSCDVKTVNGIYPDKNGNIQLRNFVSLFSDDEYNNGSKDIGNIRVTNYIDGKMDCGGW